MSGSGFVEDARLTEGVIGRRMLAWLVDGILLGLVLSVMWVVLFLFGLLTLGFGMPLLGGLWAVPTIYTFAFIASPAQATPGQAITGLVVVRDEDFGRPTPAQAAVFAIGFWLTMAAGVVWLVIALLTRRSRCLHDIVSGLVVVPQGRGRAGFRGGFPPA